MNIVNRKLEITSLFSVCFVDAEPHTYFPITLPASKIKSIDNPLPGAKVLPTSRSRKTKPQAILYNDASDQVYEVLPDGTYSSISVPSKKSSPAIMDHSSQLGRETSVGDGPIDVSEFASQLDSHDIETLETVLQSEQAQAILANLDLSGHTSSTSDSGRFNYIICKSP